MKKFVVVALLVFAVSTAVGHGDNHSELESIDEDLNITSLKDEFNANTDQMPGYVGSLIGDQKITVNFTGVEDKGIIEEDALAIDTEGKKIEELKWGSYEDTTVKFWVDQRDIEQLASSSQPLQELKKMLKNNEIRYETYTFSNKIKMAVVSLFLL